MMMRICRICGPTKVSAKGATSAVGKFPFVRENSVAKRFADAVNSAAACSRETPG
jgi:hypothetical protein